MCLRHRSSRTARIDDLEGANDQPRANDRLYASEPLLSSIGSTNSEAACAISLIRVLSRHAPGRHVVRLIECQRREPKAAEAQADAANAVAVERHLQGAAGRWIGRRGTFESDECPAACERSPRHCNAGDQLGLGEVRRVSIGKEVAHFHGAGAFRSLQQYPTVERNQKGRPATAWIGLRHGSSDRAHIADLHIRNTHGAVADNGKLAQRRRSSDLRVPSQRANLDRKPVDRYIGSARKFPQDL